MGIEGFDYDNHLTGEIKKSIADDGQISQEEAAFMVKIIDDYGRKNIKIRKNELIKLGKEFGLDYKKISKMGPSLERRLRERANILSNTKNQLSNLKEKQEKKGFWEELGNLFKSNKSDKNEGRDTKKIIEDYEKEFPTINNVEKLIKSIENNKRTRKYLVNKIKEINRNHYSDNTLITLKYSGMNDKIKVSELKGILKAINFIIKVDEKGIGNRKKGNIDTKSMRNFSSEYLRNNKEGTDSLLANLIKYVGKTEANKALRTEINNLIKKLDKHNFDIRSSAWCAAFVRLMLVKSGFKSSAKNMDNTALSALGISKTGFHIGVYTGNGRFIDGNSGANTDRVTNDSIYRGYRKKGFVGWIMPGDVGNINKVHFKLPPVIGAVMVFARGANVLSKARNMRRILKKHQK